MAVANILLANLNLSSVTGLNNWVSAQLTAAGAGNKGAKLVSMLNDFAGMTADATYGSYATAFNANVAAALIVVQTPGSLESSFAQAATPGELQLTTKVDTLTGHTFVSTPAYTPGGTDFVNTLQDEDTLTGTSAADDKLTLTLGGANDGAENVIAPTLNSIEIIDVKVSGRANTVEGSILGGLDFQDAAGLTTLNVNRITDNSPTGNAGEVKFENLADSTVNLSASNATRDGILTFDYREDELAATTNALSLDTSNLRLAKLNLTEGGDSNEDRGYFFETVKVNVKGTTNLDEMTVAANTREDTSSANASQTITITADALLEVNDLKVAGAEFINIVANKDVVIAADERTINSTTVMLTSANDGITSTQLEKMVITGAANVSIDGLDGHFHTQDSAGAAVLDAVLDAGVIVEVDASAMTGNLFLGVAQASDGEARVDSNASLAGNDLIAIDGLDIIVTSGSGNDRIETYGALAGSITTGAGNDAVSINTGADDANGIDSKGETGATVEAVSTISTGTGNDTVFAANLAAIADIETARNQTFGEAKAATVTTGEGDDTVTVTSLDSADDYSNGASLLAQWDDLVYVKGATVTTGDGSDTVTFTTAAEGASVDTGAGADQIKVTLSAQSGDVLAADRNADQITLNTATVTGNTNEVGLDGAVDRLGAVVEAGEGDDTISFTEANTLNGTTETTAAAYSLVGRDAELRGGAGTDTLNVTAFDAVTVTTTTTMTDQDSLATGVQTDINANVTGVETANFTISNQINDDTADSAKINVALNLAANDNVDTDGAIIADVLRFDASLATINLASQEKVMELNVANEAYQAGTKTAFTLMNMREGVALTLTAHEATGVGTVSSVANQIKDDTLLSISATTAVVTTNAAAADVALTINYDGSGEATDSAAIAIGAAADAAGRGNFDVVFAIGAATTDTTADATFTADTTDQLENFTINVTDGNSHSFDMGSFGDNNWGTAGADGSMTNVNSLTVNTGGAAVQVDNVGTDSVLFNNAAGTAVTAANVTVRVDQANNYTIVTGSGTDIIDMRADDVRADDILTAVDRSDKINAGAGRDTLIVGGDDSLGNNNLTTSGYLTGLSTIVDDDVFERIQSVEIVTVDTSESSSSAQRITLDEAAAEVANVDTLNIVGTGAQTVNLVLGNDFFVSGSGNGQTAGTLLVDASVTRATADTAIGALTLNVENKDDDQDVQGVDMLVRMAAGNTAGTNQTLNVLDTGDQDRGFNIVVTTNSATTAINTNISELASGATTDIDVVITSPATITDSIDSITLVEGSPILTGTTTRAEASTMDAFTIAREWTRNVADSGTKAFVFDASAILNTDSTTDTTGATGGATITVEAGDSALLNIKGTQNADAITSGTLADVVDGQGGNDTIDGGFGADSILGGAGADSIVGNTGNDTINGEAGIDRIIGGLGIDNLTGGTEADTFVYSTSNESIYAAADTITDFATGTDKIEVNYGTVAGGVTVNFGRFASTGTTGDGDLSLDGTNANKKIGDSYWSATGQLAIDVDGDGDTTDINDMVVNSVNTIAARDINNIITLSGSSANTVRLGQGVDNVTTGAGNDTFVIVGSIDQTQATAYESVGAGVVDGATTVVNYTDLLSAGKLSEANTGDVIAAGSGTDTLQVFGNADLTLINAGAALTVENLVVHSTVRLTDVQLASLTTVVLDGDLAHNVTVVDSTPTNVATDTVAALLAKTMVTDSGVNTTITITGTDGVLTAGWDATDSRLEVLTDSRTSPTAAGTALNGLSGLVVADNTVASSLAKYNAGLTGYAVVDTYTNVVAAQADSIQNAMLAAAATVTATGVTGDITAQSMTNIDYLALATGTTTAVLTAAQYAMISAAAGTTAASTAETVTLSAVTTTTTINNAVETTVLAAGTNAVTIVGGAANVTEASVTSGATTLTISGTYSGTFDSSNTTADTISLANGANIAAATIDADADNLTIASGGTVTLTQAQDTALFGGTITAAGVETVQISGTGTFSAFANVEKYITAAGGNTVAVVSGTTGVLGGAGADAITGMTAAIAIATGASWIGGSGTDTITFAAAETIAAGSLKNVSGFESIDFGAIGATSAVTLVDGITTLAADTTTAALTVSGTSTQLSALTGITNTNGTNAFNLTVTDSAGSLDIKGTTITSDVDVITFAGNGNTLTTTAANLAKITGTVVAAGTGDTLVLTSDATVDATKFAAFEVLTASGTDVDITDSGVAVARTINGDSGANVITLAGISAAKTINLGTGGTDTVALSMDATAVATINGFTAGTGGDVLNLTAADDTAITVTTSTGVVVAGATVDFRATDANTLHVLSGSSFQINGALSLTTDAGEVEAKIIAAALADSSVTTGEFLMVALDNGVDTGIYKITAATVTGALDGAAEFSVTLIASLVGVSDAGTIVAGNII
jgi:Ca2+-binding RTX toxin-like protein